MLVYAETILFRYSVRANIPCSAVPHVLPSDRPVT